MLINQIYLILVVTSTAIGVNFEKDALVIDSPRKIGAAKISEVIIFIKSKGILYKPSKIVKGENDGSLMLPSIVVLEGKFKISTETLYSDSKGDEKKLKDLLEGAEKISLLAMQDDGRFKEVDIWEKGTME